MAGALGVEPSSVVLETIILPMYYAPIINTINILTYIFSICNNKKEISLNIYIFNYIYGIILMIWGCIWFRQQPRSINSE